MSAPMSSPLSSVRSRALYLAVVQFVFISTWTIYVVFLPELLQHAGIEKTWLPRILIADQLLIAGFDLAFGIAASRGMQRYGRIAPVLLGVSLASCLAFLLMPQAGSAPALLLGLTVIWVITSSALRAPLYALLSRHAATPERTALAAMMTLGMAGAGMIAPWLGTQLKGISPALPFALSSLTLAALVLPLAAAERAAGLKTDSPAEHLPPAPLGSMAQYVMSMLRVSKIVPPKRQIIKDISLSFFPGAKIGLLGLNGSGKSTVLRIMAGVDKESTAKCSTCPTCRIGYLPQEPQLDPAKTVREEVESGSAKSWRPSRSWKRCTPPTPKDADFDKLAEEQAGTRHHRHLRRRHRNQLEIAADALRLPPWDATIGNLSGGEKRRVALCKLLLSKPDMLLLDEPTNHLDAESVEWLEQFLVRFPGHRGRRHPRPLLPRQRRRVDPRTRPRPRHPLEGQLLSAGWSRRKPAWSRESKQEGRPHEGHEAGTGMGALQPQGAPGQEQGASGPLRGNVQRRIPEAQRDPGNLHPRGRAPRRQGHRVQRRVSKAFGDAADRQPLSFSMPPGAIVGIIGPNGAGKSTLFKMITGQDKPDSGEVVIGPR
jgi:ABC-type multidrug transport system ATPase subunit